MVFHQNNKKTLPKILCARIGEPVVLPELLPTGNACSFTEAENCGGCPARCASIQGFVSLVLNGYVIAECPLAFGDEACRTMECLHIFFLVMSDRFLVLRVAPKLWRLCLKDGCLHQA